jgi:YidC/Oxa1 family membrane protein insertase
MKKNRILVLLALVVLLTTGCTKQLKNADGSVVRAEKTNQILVENVICRPNELKDEYIKAIDKKREDLLKKFEDGDISKKKYDKERHNLLDIEKLPVCKKMSIAEGGYETFWTSVFVKPLAWVIIQIGNLLKNNYALSLIIVTILIRLILLPFTISGLKQSERIKKAQDKLNKLEKKYANKNDQQSMMMKSQEMMAIYKEYNINPFAGCLVSFLQIPLFFAFYEALNRLPVLFEGKFLGLHLGMTPLMGANTGAWYYLLLPVIVGIVTYFSFKMSRAQMGDQAKQMNMMFNIMIIMIFITSFSMSTSIILYWIVSSAFSIVQTLIIKRSK